MVDQTTVDMEETNQTTKKRSREEMVGGRGNNSNAGGGRSGGGRGGRGNNQSRKKKSKSKKSSNSNETPHWVLDYEKSQKSSDQNHNVEARRTRSVAAAGSNHQSSANGKSNNNNNNTKGGGKGRGSGGGRQIDLQRNANGRGRGRGGRNNGGRGKGGRGGQSWHGGWKPTSRTVSRSSSSDTSVAVANPLSIQRKNKNTKVTTLSWIDPATHYIAIEDEEQMLPTLIHWGKSERGMMKDQPPFRLQKIQNMLSTIQKQRRTTKSTTATTNTNVSISLIQSLSYRRNQLKYLNPRLSMQQLRLGNDEDIKGAATQFERCVETYLRQQNIPFLQEWQQKQITRAAGLVNDPPSPDFMIKEGHSVQLSFTTSDQANKNSGESLVVHPLVINWIEAKMFYGASSIPKNTPNAIGCVIPKMESYVSLYGTGAIVFMYGCGSQLAAQLLEVGVVALDGRCLDLTRVEKHQKKWCSKLGEILF